MLAESIKRLVARESLSAEDSAAAFGAIMDGEASPAQIAALLVSLRMKGETVPEILGAARAMRARMSRITVSKSPLLDTCGTGGDGAGTFNISTAVAFVAAACGVAVAKHGNRAISSRSGSADVLVACGVNVEASAEVIGRCLETLNLGFLFAPARHPALKHAGPIRKELGVRTVFNLLGPLTNPAGATRQLLGVYDRALVEPIAEVLKLLGSERAWVVHGEDGQDEISLAGPTFVAVLEGGAVTRRTLSPEDVGLSRQPASALRGGSPEENAAIMREVLRGKGPGAITDAVALNAAAALHVAGVADSLGAGLQKARAALAEGSPYAVLERLAELSRG